MSEFAIALTTDVDSASMGAMNRRYAAMAINRSVKKARTLAADAIPRQINLSRQYVYGKLKVGPPATSNNLASEVTGKFRPTSLAEFARGTPESTRKAGFVDVEVKAGHFERMPRAFLIRLRGKGGSIEEGKANVGLAIRLRQGETVHNKRVSMMKTRDGLTLLYGPSVDQLFRTVREDIGPDVGDFLAKEYSRLVDVQV